MATETIEARLVISGEDRGASASIASVVKSVRQLEEVSKVGAAAADGQGLPAGRAGIEGCQRSHVRPGRVLGRRGRPRATQGAAQAATRALEQAKVSPGRRSTVCGPPGAPRRQGDRGGDPGRPRVHRGPEESCVATLRRATAAVAAQSSALQHAESAAGGFGAVSEQPGVAPGPAPLRHRERHRHHADADQDRGPKRPGPRPTSRRSRRRRPGTWRRARRDRARGRCGSRRRVGARRGARHGRRGEGRRPAAA